MQVEDNLNRNESQEDIARLGEQRSVLREHNYDGHLQDQQYRAGNDEYHRIHIMKSHRLPGILYYGFVPQLGIGLGRRPYLGIDIGQGLHWGTGLPCPLAVSCEN